MTSLKSKDDVLTLFVHLGYLAYDKKTREVFIPNKETLEICKRNSLYTKTVVQAISEPTTVFLYNYVFSPAKIRQILFQIIQRFLQIFFPNVLHDIGMMRNIQRRIHVGPGLPVELGIGAF